MAKLSWAAPERNKQPILDLLQRALPPAGTLLEVASGTGQHAVHFASHLPGWIIQPSDVEADNLASIRAWVQEAHLPNLRAPLRLDVGDEDWPLEAPVSAVFNANLIHIAPWEAALGLVRGSARYLSPGGVLVVYGPFRISGQHTAPSNQAFDASLRERDPRFGVRDLEAFAEVAEQQGLTLRERVEMPANNQTLVFLRH